MRIGVSIHSYKEGATTMTKTKHLKGTNSVVTYLFPDKYTTSESRLGVVESNISEFKIYNMFQTYILPENQNYQQYLSSEPRFKAYISLAIDTKHQYFLNIFSKNVMRHKLTKFVKISCTYYTIKLVRLLRLQAIYQHSREIF